VLSNGQIDRHDFHIEYSLYFLIYLVHMRKYCDRERNLSRDVDLFTRFELPWIRKVVFGMPSLCLYVCLYVCRFCQNLLSRLKGFNVVLYSTTNSGLPSYSRFRFQCNSRCQLHMRKFVQCYCTDFSLRINCLRAAKTTKTWKHVVTREKCAWITHPHNN
jgi:hypothetical protein